MNFCILGGNFHYFVACIQELRSPGCVMVKRAVRLHVHLKWPCTSKFKILTYVHEGAQTRLSS